MSAFLVSKETIDVIVKAAVQYADPRCDVGYPDAEGHWIRLGSPRDPEVARKLGQILWDENRRSLRARYEDREPDGLEVVRYELPLPPANAPISLMRVAAFGRGARPTAIDAWETGRKDDLAFIAKQLDCYEYQACESSDWCRTPAFYLCGSIRKWMLSSLPGWEKASWGVG